MVKDFLAELQDVTKKHLTQSVDIVPAKVFPEPGKLPLMSPNWRKIEDTVVVASDLKGSTAISYSKQDRVGARMYEASTGGCVKVVNQFTPNFVDIQGDGLFAIFHGELAHERAIACAFTLRSFSVEALAPQLAEFLGDAAPVIGESGLKVGVADGTLLAKRIGVRGEHNEAVWAGRPVNFATKCASAADRHEIVITKRVFDRVKGNDYMAFTCGCVGGEQVQQPGPIWAEYEVAALGEHSEAFIFPGASAWCENHGDEFCAAITSGEQTRADIDRAALPIVREQPAAADDKQPAPSGDNVS